MPETVKVLIVDDAPRTVDNLKRLLAFEPDIEVVGTAGNAQGGILAAHQLGPDLVLMDVNLPDMDGIKATRTLGAELPLLPVVMISVQEDREYLRQAMQAGAREYLVKPFSADELIAAIRRIRDQEERRRASGGTVPPLPARTLPPQPLTGAALFEVVAQPLTGAALFEVVAQAPPTGAPVTDPLLEAAAEAPLPEVALEAPPELPAQAAAPDTDEATEPGVPAPPPLPPRPGSGKLHVPSVSWAPAPRLRPDQTIPPRPAAPAAGPAEQAAAGTAPPVAPPAGNPAATRWTRAARADAPAQAAQDPPEPQTTLPPVPPPLERHSGVGEVIAVYSGRGGAGKTTLAVNLAASLVKETGEDVALLDLDLQFGDVALTLGIEPPGTIADAAENAAQLELAYLGGLMPAAPGGFRILAAPLRPELADLVTPAHVRAVIGLLKSAFQHVVLDLSSHIDDVALEALEAADRIVLISDLQLAAVKQAKLALELMAGLKIARGRVLLVLNRADQVGKLSPEQVASALGTPIAARIPSQEKLLLEAVESARPVVLTAPDSDLVLKMRELTGRLVPLAGPDIQQTQKTGRRRFFGRSG